MLAVDRNNPQVASLFQEFHPAVLQALSQIARSTKHMKKDIAVCGEMAGHPEAALLLTAMGYQMLSMNMTNLLLVKKALSTIPLRQPKTLVACWHRLHGRGQINGGSAFQTRVFLPHSRSWRDNGKEALTGPAFRSQDNSSQQVHLVIGADDNCRGGSVPYRSSVING